MEREVKSALREVIFGVVATMVQREARRRRDLVRKSVIRNESIPTGFPSCGTMSIENSIYRTRRRSVNHCERIVSQRGNHGPLSNSFLTSFVPRCSRAGKGAWRGQKRVRDSNSVVLLQRIMACPFARLPLCRRVIAKNDRS